MVLLRRKGSRDGSFAVVNDGLWHCAAHLIEQLLSPHARTGRLGWGRKEPLEIRHAVDEVEAFRVGSVLWIGNRVALRDGRRQDAVGIVLGGDQSVGQSHFFSGRITAERKNGGQLAFPAEAAHSSGSWIFKQWDDVRSPAYARPTGLQSQEVGIGDGFHQAVAQHADGESVGHDVGHGRQFFSAGQINARDLEQGTAVFLELDESLFFVFHAEANHGLAAMAADRVVVAVGTGLLVEDRPQAILGDEGGVVELGPGLKTGGVRGIKARNGITHAGLKLHLTDDQCHYKSAHHCSMSSILSIRWKSQLVPSH